MTQKKLLAGFLFLSCILYCSAKINDQDVEALQSAWRTFSKTPKQYAIAMIDNYIDWVIMPIADEILRKIEMFLPPDARKEILVLLPTVKTVTVLPAFGEMIERAAKIITEYIIPKLHIIRDAINDMEQILTTNIDLSMTILMYYYHEILEKSRPVFERVMALDFKENERVAISKVITELENINEDMLKRVLKGICL